MTTAQLKKTLSRIKRKTLETRLFTRPGQELAKRDAWSQIRFLEDELAKRDAR